MQQITRETPVTQINFGKRIWRCLRENNITTIGELIDKKTKELIDMETFGDVSLAKIILFKDMYKSGINDVGQYVDFNESSWEDLILFKNKCEEAMMKANSNCATNEDRCIKRLGGRLFVRINVKFASKHASRMIAWDSVEFMYPRVDGQMDIVLKGHDDTIHTDNSFYEIFKELSKYEEDGYDLERNI